MMMIVIEVSYDIVILFLDNTFSNKQILLQQRFIARKQKDQVCVMTT